MQQVHPIHRGAPAGQKGRCQQGGIEGPQLLLDHLQLQGEMTAQGGITTAQDQPAIQHPLRLGLGQGRRQGPTDLLHPLARLIRGQGPGIGQHKQQR